MSKRFKKIYFEIGNVCNLQCSFCPEVERAKFQIQLDHFRQILEKINPLTERVCFHLMGEPTAHPQFSKLVSTASEMGTSIEITTNGTLLSKEITEALLNPGVVQVNFSLQSFFDNFPGKDASIYLNKIFLFTERALELRPDLYINYRLWNHGASDQAVNESVLQKIESFFHIEINRNVDLGFRKSKNLRNRLYLHFDQRFEWPSLKSDFKSQQGKCYGGLDHIGIHASGEVVPCCLDKEAVLSMGNVYENDLGDILGSKRFTELCSGFQRAELKEELCQRCDYVTRFQTKTGRGVPASGSDSRIAE